MRKSAKHTKQSFNDQHAIGLISGILASTHRVMPDLKANDKWPNIDGIIEVTDKDGHPIGILKVQVKKLTRQRAKSKSFYFKTEDDKFLEYCRESKDWIPILLIGVDVEKEKAYWIHIDHDYLEANGGSRTIHFSESQIIEKKTLQYVEDWEKLLDLYSTKSQFFDQYKQAYSILADVVTPALGKSDQSFKPIHMFLDHTNYLLDHLFPVVKRIYYPATWKLGFALYKFTELELMYSLYPIAKDRNDVQIKEVDPPLHDLLRGQGLDFSMHRGNPILDSPENFAVHSIQEKVFNILQNQMLNHAGNEFLAREYVFAFIDKFYIQLGLEIKDTYSIEDIENGFYKYLPIWIEESYGLLVSNNRNNIDARVKRNGYFSLDILGEVIGDELAEIQKRVEKRIATDSNSRPMYISTTNDLRVGTFRDFLNYLKQIVEKIDRPYKVKDYGRANGFVHNTLSKEDALFNLNEIINHYQATYENIIANNFPNMQDDLSLFRDYDKILYYFDISDDRSLRPGNIYNSHRLRGKSKKIEKEVRIIDSSTSEKLFNKSFVNSSVEFEGETYDSYNGQGSLDFLYKSTPLLDLIYSTLEENMKNFFERQDKANNGQY